MKQRAVLRSLVVLSLVLSCALPELAQAPGDQGALPSFGQTGENQELRLAILTEVSFDSSRGGLWALEPGIGLNASWAGNTHASIGYSQAFGSFDGSGAPRYRALEAANLSVGWQTPARSWARFDFVAFTRYETLGSAGDEARFGGIVTALASPLAESSALSFSATAGYSRLMIRPDGKGGPTWTDDPLIGLGLYWQSSAELRFGIKAADYHGVDADLVNDTFFELQAETKLNGEGSQEPALADFCVILVCNALFGSRATLSGAEMQVSVRFPLADSSLHASIGSE